MTAANGLPDRLEALIAAHPDVEIVYSAHPAVREIASHAIGALVGAPKDSRVLVTENESGTAVSVSVGVTGERSAAEVGRTLHELLTAELIRLGASAPITVAVKVSSIA